MTKQKDKSKDQQSAIPVPKSLQIAVVVAIVAGLIFISPYFGTILFSALIAFIFNPVYKSILRKTGRTSIAVFGTLTAAALSVVIPCFFIATVTVAQINSIVSEFNSSSVEVGPAQIEEVVDRGIDRVNAITTALPGGEELQIDKEKIFAGLKNAVVEGLNFLINALKDIGLAFFGLISTFILSIFLIIGMLTQQKELIAILRRVSPFDDSINNLYLHKAGLMTKAMVKGQLLIAVAQGIASALSLWIVGLDYFWFFLMILTFLSFIPLGGGIITIPIGVILILSGNIWQGVFVILWHMFVVSFIDNLMRPRLVHKDARLSTSIMLLAVFSGIAIFGAPGVVYGPVVMILILTTIYVYAEYNSRTKRASLPQE